MSSIPKKISRLKTQQERLIRQFRFAQKSFAIDGIHLFDEVYQIFKKSIFENWSQKELNENLQPHFDKYEKESLIKIFE